MSQLPSTPSRIRLFFPAIGFVLFLTQFPGFMYGQNVGINTETPQAGLHVISNNGMIISGEQGQGINPLGGYGTSMVWNSKTGSMRFGRISNADGGVYEDWWSGAYTGDYSIVSGLNSKAYGFTSSAFGEKAQAIGISSFVAGGISNIASGDLSFVSGVGNQSQSYAEFVIGANATLSATGNAAAFQFSDRLFVIGNGENISERHNAMTVMKNGNIGIGTETPSSLLHIDGTTTTNDAVINDSLRSAYFQLTTGAANGYFLRGDEDGNASWIAPTDLLAGFWNANGENIYNDNSMNVGIGVSTPTEPLHVNGNMRLHAGRLKITGTGQSVFIGQDAGMADDLTDNKNVFIGHEAGKSNINGNNNIAIGSFALDQATESYYNIALGENALGNNAMTGNFNISLGNFSMQNNVEGHNNIALGQSTLEQNDSGFYNIAVGNYAMDANTTGSFNTAMGTEALGLAISADKNTSVGYKSLYSATGSKNTAIGYLAGFSSVGGNNVFIGHESGSIETGSNKLYISNSSTTNPLIYGDFSIKKVTINDSLQIKNLTMSNGAGYRKVMEGNDSGRAYWVTRNALFEDAVKLNICLGTNSGQSITTAHDNTTIGSYAGEDLVSGYENSAYGKAALQNTTFGSANTAIGYNALNGNTNSHYNTAIGWEALSSGNGYENVAVGAGAGSENVSGGQNVYIGIEAGMNCAGSGNVFLGRIAGKNATGSNKLMIDNTSTSSPLIYGDFSSNEVTINDSLTVGKELGVATSTPNSTFEVNGSIAAKFKTPLVAGTTNPDDTGMVWRYTSGNGTITLPAATSCANRMYVIINQTGSTRTISTYRDLVTNSQTMLSSSVALWLMSDGTEWWQIK